MTDFSTMLTYYRKTNHMTQNELAKKIGVSVSTIGMYESGKRYPTREIEEALADYFNVNIRTLRGQSESEEKHLIKTEIVQDFIFDALKKETITELYDILGDITEDEAIDLLNYARFIAYKRKKK